MAGAAPRLRSAPPGPTAEDSWHRAFRSASSGETPETSSGPPPWTRPTSRWVSPYRSHLSRAPAGFRRRDRKSELSGRVPCAWIFWRISFRVKPRAPSSLRGSSRLGGELALNRRTPPAPLPGAATKPGALLSESLCAWTRFLPQRHCWFSGGTLPDRYTVAIRSVSWRRRILNTISSPAFKLDTALR